LLLEVHTPGFGAARDALGRFADLEKSPEHIHTYRITPLSLWNAASAGDSAEAVVDMLRQHAKYGVPKNVIADIDELMGRFGTLRLLPGNGDGPFRLEIDSATVRAEIEKNPATSTLVRQNRGELWVEPLMRGTVKQTLARLGYPVDDRIAFVEGEHLGFAMRTTTLSGKPFALRPYQKAAVDAFTGPGVGHGVLALPCGAGKTVIGMATAAAYQFFV